MRRWRELASRFEELLAHTYFTLKRQSGEFYLCTLPRSIVKGRPMYIRSHCRGTKNPCNRTVRTENGLFNGGDQKK